MSESGKHGPFVPSSLRPFVPFLILFPLVMTNCMGKDAVKAPVDAQARVEGRAEVDPQIAAIATRLEARIEKLESIVTIGGEHAVNTAGGDISTEVESQVARTATRFLGWALILVLVISVGAAGAVVFLYVAAHRVAAVRRAIDAVKGKGCSSGAAI